MKKVVAAKGARGKAVAMKAMMDKPGMGPAMKAAHKVKAAKAKRDPKMTARQGGKKFGAY